MDSIGIICEYNPFHNGHLYHINKCKELFPDSVIVLVLNGYFLERGDISILTKEDKSKIALEAGVDLVIELPFVFGTQSADIFAYNSIKLLDSLKVDKILFGSESNNIELLERIVEFQLNNKEYNNNVKELMDQGINYPTAMAKALNIKDNINNPNDLLGISYIKAIKQINNKIKYYTIKRTNDFHDNESNNNVVSASNIREKIKNNIDIVNHLPKYSFDRILNVNFDYFNLLKYKIIIEKDLSIYLDVDEGIENRLKIAINNSNSLDELIKNVKTKRYTYNKINRMFIHILIGLTKEDVKDIKLDYIKLLGFNTLGKKYLNRIKKNIELPLFNKSIDSMVYNYEMIASKVYDLITNLNTMDFEKKNKPVD